jgi:hypothetical protein
VIARLERRKDLVKARITLVIAQPNPFIRQINAFNALKTLVIRLLDLPRGPSVPMMVRQVPP